VRDRLGFWGLAIVTFIENAPMITSRYTG
jgi:hypothetical protein